MLAEHIAAPREGHLTAAFHVSAYLKNKHNVRLIYDPSYPQIEISDFKNDEEWKAFYGEVKEAIPPSAPPPRGRSVMMPIVKNAVVNLFSKKQGSIKHQHLEVNSLQ
jgi:hypothetical protein